ncbi:carbohydrate ABC transporter permease [Acidaminobacter sp. JC074]|uniref:carbohydrate ABC transporter permease n=1 Tax=Acidaminobacter sp. JC074 TaxID=2530199 RepID=UPI001F0EB448|nr:carbohydrate ABC transporter permease [Acidaminobacter sp. JC074]MCH4889623.1 carbohydrate ABC transporter permease [Acidaminobacter sp. JC074]
MKKSKNLILYIVGGLLAVFYIFPFLLILLNAFKEKSDIIKSPLGLPETFSFDNFAEAMEKMDFFRAIGNSFLITIIGGLVLIFFASMFAYYLSRSKSKFSKVIFFIMVASMIIPFQALMVPFVSIYGKLDMLNSRAALIFFYLGFGISLSTFLYHGFVKNIPVAIDEAARIDGASNLQVFWLIIFPMLKPVTATVSIINALWIWNDFLLPSLVLHSESRTLPLSTFVFYGKYTSNYGLAMAGLVLSVIPIIVFYLIMQKQIVSGVSNGSIK